MILSKDIFLCNILGPLKGLVGSMPFIYFLLSLITLNVIYVAGQMVICLLLKMRHHYFLGYNPRFFDVNILNTKFSVGLYIPIIGLAKIYRVDDNGKKMLFYPWQFLDQPLWKRILVTYSGLVSLMVFYVIYFIIYSYTVEETYIPKEEANKYGLYPSPAAEAAGFFKGDKVVAVNGRDFDSFFDLQRGKVTESEQVKYSVLRDGNEIQITVKTSDLWPKEGRMFLDLLVPFEIDYVKPGSIGESIGLQKGDRIIKVNNQAIIKYNDMWEELRRDADGTARLEIERVHDNSTTVFEKIVTLNYDRSLGITVKELYPFKQRQNTFTQAIKLGANRCFSSFLTSFKIFTRIFIPEFHAYKKLRGPIGFTQLSFEEMNWVFFWNITTLYASLVVFFKFLAVAKIPFVGDNCFDL